MNRLEMLNNSHESIKFTLEELIGSCCILEGINEKEFTDYLIFLSSNNGFHIPRDKNGNPDYQSAFKQYLASPSSQPANINLVKAVLAKKHSSPNLNSFTMTSSAKTQQVQTEDPLDSSMPFESGLVASEHDQSYNEKKASDLIEASLKFQKFVQKCRCEENLQFLIDIYRYERLWNLCFVDRRYSILKQYSEKQNPINDYVNPFASSRRVSRNPSEALRRQNFIDSFDCMKGSFDMSSIVDTNATKNLRSSLADSLSNGWDLAFSKKFDLHGGARRSSKDSSASDNMRKPANAILISTDPTLESQLSIHNHFQLDTELCVQLRNFLNTSWRRLLKTYVEKNAPHQINLPQDVLKNLINENKNENILHHSPIVLVAAKDSVVQLLRDNTYHSFLRFCNGEQFQERAERSGSISSIVSSMKSSHTGNSIANSFYRNRAIGSTSTKRTSILSNLSKHNWLRKSAIFGSTFSENNRSNSSIFNKSSEFQSIPLTKEPVKSIRRSFTTLKSSNSITQRFKRVSRSATDPQTMDNYHKQKFSMKMMNPVT